MGKKFIHTAEDFFNVIEDYCTDSYSDETSSLYNISDKYGKGTIETLNFGNGLCVCLQNILCADKIKIRMEHETDLREICYCNHGAINCYEESIGNIPLEEGSYALYTKPYSRGWMEYPVNIPTTTVSICISNDFFSSNPCKHLLSGSLFIDNLDEYSIHELMLQKKPDKLLGCAFEQMCVCPFKGLSRLLYLESRTLEILSYLIDSNKLYAKTVDRDDILLSSHDVRKLQHARSLLENEIENPPSIEELADTVLLNSYKMKKGFKKLFGTTVYGYIKQLRLTEAKRLLVENEEKKIIEIVNEVGYCNPGHFAKAFKERYGLSPKNYRHIANKAIINPETKIVS